MKTIRIDIRYCGGCNPDYDRTRLAADLKRALADRCVFDGNTDLADWIVVIHGCPTACADTAGLPLDRCIFLTRPADADHFIAGIRSGDATRFASLRGHP